MFDNEVLRFKNLRNDNGLLFKGGWERESFEGDKRKARLGYLESFLVL